MPFRLGVVGAGHVVEAYHASALRALPDTVVEWVADRDLDAARRIARLLRARTWTNDLPGAADVDATLIAVPLGARDDVLTQVVSRGWHALCEKPFASSVEQHERFLAMARERRVRLQVGLVRRQYATTHVARSILADGVLGDVNEVLAGAGTVLRRTGRPGTYYLGDPTSGGGELFETGSHLIDQLLAIVGAVDHSVDRCRQTYVGALESETAASGHFVVTPGHKVPFSIVVTRINDVYNGILVRCERGSLRIGLGPEERVELWSRDDSRLAQVDARSGPTNVFSAMAAQWTQFIRACQRGTAFVDDDTGLQTTRFICDCYRIAERREMNRAL